MRIARKTSVFALAILMTLTSMAEAQKRRQHQESGHEGQSHSRARADRQSRDVEPPRTGGSQNSNQGSPSRSGDGGRFNPFSRSAGGQTDRDTSTSRNGSIGAPGGSRGHAVLGTPIRNQSAANYDGRAAAARPQSYGASPLHNMLGVSIAGGSGLGTSVAVGAQVGGLRIGFVSYANPAPRGGFNAPSPYAFAYPNYVYDPYAPGAVVVASPWYGYSFMPPYLDGSQVIYETGYPAWGWDGWSVFNVDQPRVDPSARDAVDDLRDAFESESGRLADKLVPERGDVAILNHGKYDYSLDPDGFQKMFLDGVEQSKTVDYKILEARYRGDAVRVRAKHTFIDSWGDTQSEIHRVTLRREKGGDYVVREFGTE